ncbi:MAG: proprotein convertase P-domain-containing protein [Myxococcota bacterium]
MNASMNTFADMIAALALSGLVWGAVACDAPQSNALEDAPLSDYDALFADAPGNDELPYQIKADGPAPRTFDLVDLQSPVKSQGSRGVCSIFSTVALMEHLYIAAGVEEADFSEQYLQWSVKEQLGLFTDSSGSNSTSNLRAIQRHGIPHESAWEYETREWGEEDDPACTGPDRPTFCFTNGSPPDAAVEAEKFFLPRGRWLNSGRESLLDHMRVSGTGVVVGLDFFYQAWNHGGSSLTRSRDAWRQGIVGYPNADDIEESRRNRAGHSVLLVGWDLDMERPRVAADGSPVLDAEGNQVMDEGFYIFKNSWGTHNFGVDNPYGAGYGFLSMDYVEDFGSARVSDVPYISVPEPEPEPEVEPEAPPESELYESLDVVDIPDNDAVGIKSTLSVPTEGNAERVTVNFEVEHTYRGDLTVRLLHGSTVVTLHDRAGGSADGLELTRELTDFAGEDRGGDWQLQIADNASADTGRLLKWSLVIE